MLGKQIGKPNNMLQCVASVVDPSVSIGDRCFEMDFLER